MSKLQTVLVIFLISDLAQCLGFRFYLIHKMKNYGITDITRNMFYVTLQKRLKHKLEECSLTGSKRRSSHRKWILRQKTRFYNTCNKSMMSKNMGAPIMKE